MDLDPHILSELTRAVAWFATGFAAAVVTFPFVASWWPDGGDGE